MEAIKGYVDLRLSVEEVATINRLIMRDKEMPLVIKYFENNEEKRPYYNCPVCNEYHNGDDKFCSNCGQRIDTENIAL